MESVPNDGPAVNGEPQQNGHASPVLSPAIHQLQALVDAHPELRRFVDLPNSEPMPTDWPEPADTPQAGTVADVVKLYLSMAAPKLAGRENRNVRHVLGLFVDEFGTRRVARCKSLDLFAFLQRHPEWKSNWTRNRVITTIKRPFNWCLKMGIVDRNPFAGVTQTKGEPGRPMEPEEYQAILRHADADLRRILTFLRFTGARPSELRALQWEHIHLDRGCCTLTEHKTKKSRRDCKPRTIILHPVALKLLLWMWRQPGRKSPFVFVNRRGGPWTNSAIELRLWRIKRRLGLPMDCRYYGLRHLFGTTAIKNGVDVSVLSELMGHTTVAMTMHYVHLAGDTRHLQEAVRIALRRTRP